MNVESKIRLIGLNNLLSDLFEKDILISEILKESGLSEYQVERIRHIHLDEYLKKVNHNIYHFVSGVLSERYAKILKFCYYFDGRKPKSNQSIEEKYNNKRHRIYQLQADLIINLKNNFRLPLFKNIMVTAANDILKYERTYIQKYNQMKKRKKLIEKSAKRIQNAKEKKAKKYRKPYRKKNLRVPERVFEHHEPNEPKRMMFNPWVGSKRYSSNWW